MSLRCYVVLDKPARRCRNRTNKLGGLCWRHATKVVRSDRAKERARKLESMSDCNLCCFWIDPLGYSYHLNDAAGLLGSHGGVAEYVLGDPTRGRRLDDEGYVHASFGDPFMGDGHMVPTQAQLDRLFDIQQELSRRGAKTQSRAEYIQRFIDSYAERMPV